MNKKYKKNREENILIFIKDLLKIFGWLINLIYYLIPSWLSRLVKKTWKTNFIPFKFVSILLSVILIYYCLFIIFHSLFFTTHLLFHLFSDGYWCMMTYYGPGFYGQKTADGAYYTKNSEPFVASRILPLKRRIDTTLKHQENPAHTSVKISYQDREIVVPVRDRGPYRNAGSDPTDGWVTLDANYTLARELGLLKNGKGWVQVKINTLIPVYKFRTYRGNGNSLHYYTRNFTWQVKIINFFMFKPWVVFNPWFEKKLKDSNGRGVDVWMPYNFWPLKKPVN